MLKSLKKKSLYIALVAIIAIIAIMLINLIVTIASEVTMRNEKLNLVKGYIASELSEQDVSFDELSIWYTEYEELYDSPYLIKVQTKNGMKNIKVQDISLREMFKDIDNKEVSCYDLAQRLESFEGLRVDWL